MFVNPRTAAIGEWRGACVMAGMFARAARLFTIKTKFEAFVVIYGLALGAAERGVHYLGQYPGHTGWVLFAACPAAVFMAGGRILDSLDREADRRA